MNVNNYIGLPYSLRDISGCVNCWGLVALIYNNELDKSIPIFKSKKLAGISAAFSAAFATGEHGFCNVDSGIDFDVVVFVSDGGRAREFHCGIMYNGKVLHATNKMGQVVYQTLQQASEGYNRVEFWRR